LFILTLVLLPQSLIPLINQLKDFIAEKSIDILSLTETWLSPDTPPSILNSLTPINYSLLHEPRAKGRGGGIALIHRSFLKVSRIPLPTCSSFEALCVRLSYSTFCCSVLSVYRPPNLSKTDFLTEFSSLLEILIPSTSNLFFTGDFNYHLDCSSEPSVSQFLCLLDTFDLTQHVTFSTHASGHTLDLFITHSASSLISNIDFHILPFTDHYSIHSTINVPVFSRSPRILKQIRAIRSIDPTVFSADILASPLYTDPPADLHSYSALFSSTLSSLLDKHAPLKTISCPSKQNKPFITPEILQEKTKRSKLESVYRRSKTDQNRINFKN